MKTIISSTDNKTTAAFDKRFGRAAWFCVFDTVTKNTFFLENTNAEANHGAGTKAAEKMAELQAEKIISGDFGPKAKELLEKFNIQMEIVQEDNLTIEQIISKLN